MAATPDVTDQDFGQSVLQAETPTVVDFWAPWCGPCKMVAPAVEALNAEYAGQVKFVKLNVDDNPQVSMQYGVSSIPTLIVFRNGEEVERIVGYRPQGQLKAKIDQAIAPR